MIRTLTTEQLRALRDALKSWQDGYDPTDDKEQYEMFVTAETAVGELLTNREAQPVAWRHDDGPFAGIAITRAKSVADSWIANGWTVTPLYTAPPAPAVPPEIPLTSPVAAEYVAGWNACRAAILAKPVSGGCTLNSPEIPDGWIACSEHTPVTDGAYWCWFGKEKPSVIQQRVCIWNDRNHEWCDSTVTHWMPLPAAPEGGNG